MPQSPSPPRPPQFPSPPASSSVRPRLFSSRDEVETYDDDGVNVGEHVGVSYRRVVQAPEKSDEPHAPTERRGEHQPEHSRFLGASPAFA